MSRKDYEMIAAILKEEITAAWDNTGKLNLLIALARKMADAFTLDNDQFKPAVFLKACGIV